MKPNEYLTSLLEAQTVSQKSVEYQALIAKRTEVESFLRKAFPSADITFKYGGSIAKHTMILANFDLDLICYFARDEVAAGNSLEEIYETVREKLSHSYHVNPKTSALRLEEGENNYYTHVDVVPGRFINESKTDVFLHQNGGSKNRLRTNTKTHITTIRDSGLTDVIKLLKLWRECSPFVVKTFVLELLAVDILTPHKGKSLETELLAFWQEVSENIDKRTVTDPANSGNDLGEALNNAKPGLKAAAQEALDTIAESGWEKIFELMQNSTPNSNRINIINSIPTVRPQGARPWASQNEKD